MAARLDIDQLFRKYYRQMCLYALHYIQDGDAVEDIVQESFVSLWNKVQQGSVPLQPRAYLASIVRNGCIDYIRRQATHQEEAITESVANDDADFLSRSEIEAELWRELDTLPPGRRKMLLLHKRDGLSHKEIASKLGVSEGTVRNRISKALKSLRGKKR